MQSESIANELKQTKEPTYPSHLLVQYTNDKEYRQCLRDICHMQRLHLTHYTPPKVDAVDEDDDIDDVTRDEWDYDADAMTQLLDHVYATTHFLPLFQTVYLTAAGTMFSEELQIGLTVLFSYDYFQQFHACLSAFYLQSELYEPRMENMHRAFQRNIWKKNQSII